MFSPILYLYRKRISGGSSTQIPLLDLQKANQRSQEEFRERHQQPEAYRLFFDVLYETNKENHMENRWIARTEIQSWMWELPMSPNIESKKKADFIKTPKTAMDVANHS